MKLNKRVIYLSIFISTIILSGTLSIFSISPQNEPLTQSKDEVSNKALQTSQISTRKIRVAIYNEPNLTKPAYVSANEWLHNSYSDIKALLKNNGHQVSELTCSDIYSHKLKTAIYDVFIMVDNIPKVNITNQVKEFWLGGGGILSFGGAINYLCYAGILPPESVNDDGYLTYWTYSSTTTTQNITVRHPITKSYQVGDKFTATSGPLTSRNYFYWNILQTTSIASQITKLANEDGDNNKATVVAFDSINLGGRVVQIPGDGDPLNSNMNNLIKDAVDWLCPRPKARILYDLSHDNGYGMDSWDDPLVQFSSTGFSILRNALVSRDYTVDKLYNTLGSDTFTSGNLAPYDLLIVSTPDITLSASEISAVNNWTSNGGGLLAIANSPEQSVEIDNLLAFTGLSILSADSFSATMSINYEHPTKEACSGIAITGGSAVGYSGSAFPLWNSSSTVCRIAGQEYGNGSVILVGDLGTLGTSIIFDDNLQYGINVVNWLSSCQAEVLLMVTEDLSPNYYKSPVSQALNDLNISFYLTFEADYFNLSLCLNNWDLVIIDTPKNGNEIAPFHNNLIDYIDLGGHLIYSTYYVDVSPTNPFWDYLGFEYNADILNGPPVYIWDDDHPIFNFPASYRVNNFISTNNFGDDGDRLTLYPNATALAGYTSTESTGNAIIVLRNDRKTLFNGYLIDEFTGDTNDDTYKDSYELWLNEIAFMMFPSTTPSGDGDDDDDDEKTEFPWLLLIIILAAIFGIIAIVAIVLILKKKR